MKSFYVSKVHLPFFLILVVAFSIKTTAQTFTPVTARITKHIGGYWEYLPRGYDSTSPKKYPLLFYIHGIGEIGNGDFYDLKKLLKNDIPRLITQKRFPESFRINKDTFQFIVICPQLSVSGRTWTEIDDFIDTCVARYNIDQSRMYIMGLSYGGGTAMFYCTDSVMGGKRFAAFATASQNLVVRDVPLKNLTETKLPIWFAVNNGDHVVLPSTTTDWVNRLKAMDYQPRPLLDRYDANGHDAWSKMFNPTTRPRGLNVYEWMLQFTRPVDSLYPRINAPDSVRLPDNTILLDGSSSTSANHTPIASYEWQYVNGPTRPVFQSQADVMALVTNLVAGTYTFRLTIKTSSGAMFSTDKRVVVVRNMLPVPIISADTSIYLPVDSITLNGTKSHDTDGYIVSYGWQQVSGPAVYSNVKDTSKPVLSLHYLAEGTYSFALTVTDNRSGIASDTFRFVVHPPVKPVAIITGNTSISLPTDSIILSGASSYDKVTTITSYKWQYIAGPQGFSMSSPSADLLHINHLVVGRYTVGLTVTNSQGGAMSDTFSFMVKPNGAILQKEPVAIIQGDTLVMLPADSVTLTGLSSYDLNGNIRKYLWSAVSGPSAVSIVDSSSPSIVLRNLSTGIYTISLTVTNDKGGMARDTFKFDVSLNQSNPINPPVAVISGSSTIILPINVLSLDGRYSYSAGDSIVSYLWQCVSGPGGFSVSDSALQAITIKNLIEGAYVFKLIVHNSRGASAADSIHILVLRKQGGGSITTPSLQIVTRPGLTLAPVPVNSYLGVYLNDSATGKLSLHIIDMNGRIVARKENDIKAANSWKTIMNVANLVAGYYFVEITIGKESFRARFIK